jgi:hypothetical protein
MTVGCTKMRILTVSECWESISGGRQDTTLAADAFSQHSLRVKLAKEQFWKRRPLGSQAEIISERVARHGYAMILVLILV